MSNELNNKRIEEILSKAKEVKVIKSKQNFGAVWMPQKNNEDVESTKEEPTEPIQKRPPFFWI